MRIFITGTTGYIGGAVAALLRDRGHEVTALVRAESDVQRLREREIALVSGNLATLPHLTDTLRAHDAYVHTAQAHTADAVTLDKTAVGVFTSQNGFFVFTSGVWVLGNAGGGTADESTPVHPLALVAWRPAHEQQALATGRSAVVRPGCVYGGKQSMLAGWFAAADRGKPVEIVGDGRNRWAMVDLHDLAHCYVAVVERKAAGIFHAVDDTRATLDECARAIAPSGKIEHTPVDAARPKLGPLVDALIVDQQVSSEATRRTLGWRPRRNFIESVGEQWREWRDALSPAAAR
jgi:nucleoside-diphosphate-sugar epimerase